VRAIQDAGHIFPKDIIFIIVDYIGPQYAAALGALARKFDLEQSMSAWPECSRSISRLVSKLEATYSFPKMDRRPMSYRVITHQIAMAITSATWTDSPTDRDALLNALYRFIIEFWEPIGVPVYGHDEPVLSSTSDSDS
jgi:hypothetical protein